MRPPVDVADAASRLLPGVQGREVGVRLCPGGPLLVRGADTVRDEQGEVHEVTRPVVALCACGRSARQPWCDSTHKALRR